jgi:hypothetical protein
MNKLRLSAMLALFAASNGLPAEDIKPGLWKISLESSVANTPDWRPEPFELTQCLTENDARNPDRLLAGMGGSGAFGCELLNRQTTGDHIGFDLRCAGDLGLQGHGEVSFTATSLDGVLDVNFGAGEQTGMHNKLHAVYLGSCAETGGG